MTKQPPYFMYFPGNYRWSAAILGMLSSAGWGGADIAEVEKIGRRLRDVPGTDDDAWFDACIAVADEVRSRAAKYEESGYVHSAAPMYLRACKYFQMGERFRTPKDEQALAAYRASIDCFHRFARHSEEQIEVVEVPYDNGSLPGYFVHAHATAGAKAPSVVFFDGLDITKELLYMRGVPDLVKRGISCLVMDGPGTGWQSAAR